MLDWVAVEIGDRCSLQMMRISLRRNEGTKTQVDRLLDQAVTRDKGLRGTRLLFLLKEVAKIPVISIVAHS